MNERNSKYYWFFR